MKLSSLWLALLNWYVGTLARASMPADWDVLRHVNLKLAWLKFKVQNFSLFSDVQAFRSSVDLRFWLAEKFEAVRAINFLSIPK